MSRSTILILFTVVGCSLDDPSTTHPAVVIENDETQPIYDYDEAIREVVYVESTIDSDHDGKLDRIALDIMRPKETSGELQVATVMEASPYYFDGVNPPEAGGRQVPAGAPRGFYWWYDEFFVPRGYAVVEVEMQGTGRSQGCPTTGGPEDTASIVAAIDWLNGRTKGYTAKIGGQEVSATWSTGAVGMLGVSYNGTLPTAVAATGVEGLKTIVPIAAISSWYDYTRDLGIGYSGWDSRYPEWLAQYVVSSAQQVTCTDELDKLGDEAADDTFDHTPFWDARDYRLTADKIKASVFVVHGQEDWNVKPHHYGRLWQLLVDHDVPRKIWLHNDGHMDPVSLRPDEWKTEMHHWMDHWLYDIDNGVMEEPMGVVQRANGTWESRDQWPAKATREVSLYLAPAGKGLSGRLLQSPPEIAVSASFLDTPFGNEYTKAIDPEVVKAGRLAFATDVLDAPVRIAGTPRVKVTASLDTASGPLSALLVDYGESTTIVPRNQNLLDRLRASCNLENLRERTGCAEPGPEVLETVSVQIITRGTIDTKNRDSIKEGSPVTPGQSFEIQWQLHPKDHVFPAGHRIGLIITGNNNGYATLDQTVKNVTIKYAGSKLILPVESGFGPDERH